MHCLPGIRMIEAYLHKLETLGLGWVLKTAQIPSQLRKAFAEPLAKGDSNEQEG